MSGLCGVAGLSTGLIDSRQTSSMLEQIKHRPSDTTSSFTDKDSGASLGQIHHSRTTSTRLTSQGFSQPTGAVAVLHGRIVNRDGLQFQLPADSFPLHSDDDAKVLLAAYKVFGKDLFAKLDGAFVAAVWDAERKQLMLSRDRLGQKSIYYFVDAEHRNLVFASEIKAILANPLVEASVDLESMSLLFAFGYVPGSRTLFKNIKKLLPGEMLTFEPGSPPLRTKYWQPPEVADGFTDASTCAQGLRELFLRGLEGSLAGAREIGVFLSGGIASSLIVAALAELGVPRVSTFTLGYRAGNVSRKTDDLEYGRLVARKFGTDHHEVVVEPAHDPGPWLALIADQFEDVVMTPNAYGLWRLCEAAQNAGLSTVLAGTGAAGDWDVENRLLGLDWQAKWLAVTRNCASDEERYLALYGTVFPLQEQIGLLTHPPRLEREDVLASLRPYFQDLSGDDTFKRLLFGKLLIAPAEESLRVLDKIGLLKSLETSFPFMNRALVEFSTQVPVSFDGGNSFVSQEMLLRKAFEDELPQAVLNRRSLDSINGGWKRPALHQYQRALLTGEQDTIHGIHQGEEPLFDPNAIARVLKEDHAPGAAGKRAWLLTQFVLWNEIHVKLSRAWA